MRTVFKLPHFIKWALTGLGLLVIGGGLFISPVLRTGSGYAAKQICSGYFLSGMEPQTIIDQALVGASPILANISAKVDQETGYVNTWLYGLFHRTAVYNAGTGCTLIPAGDTVFTHGVEATTFTADMEGDALWPPMAMGAVDKQQLNAVLDWAFQETDPAAPLNTKAVVVLHDGHLIAERYGEGINASTPLLGWSMSKSVTNLLLGVLVAQENFDIKAPAPVPQWTVTLGDPRAQITTDQLLRMSSGLVFDEEYSLASDATNMLSREGDMAGFAASKPLDAAPDTKWNYSSGTSNILSGIIRRTIGGDAQQFYDYTQQNFFQSLGIKTATLELDASGTFVGSSYIYASARDWAKMGQLCLQKGQWQGQQLLPANWIDYTTTPTATSSSNFYGAHFWLNRDPTDKDQARAFPLLPEDTFAMDGYQGQHVVIIPSKKLVVVRMGFTPAGNQDIEQLVHRLIGLIEAPKL